MSVVEKLSLDHLVDEKRRAMYSDHGGYDGGGGQRSPNIMDIRKQILGASSDQLLSLFARFTSTAVSLDNVTILGHIYLLKDFLSWGHYTFFKF